MVVTEINPKGNFDSWEKSILDEIKHGGFIEAIGKALFENEHIKLWEIYLKPSERIPFRAHYNNCSCTSFSDGLLVSRNINGEVVLMRIEKGGTLFWKPEGKAMVHDLVNVGETAVRISVLEEKRKMNS